MKLARTVMAISAALSAPGCVTIQALEPVISPPSHYLADATVGVEFLPAIEVGLRCAERGAKFLGLPGINSSACADTSLITMLDPCMTITAGRYARGLCSARASIGAEYKRSQKQQAELQQISNFDRDVPSVRQESDILRVEFIHPALLANVCRRQNLQLAGEPGALYCMGDGTLMFANPCSSERPGWYERTLCHELAHANGWPADHSAYASAKPLPRASTSPEALAYAAQSAHNPAGSISR